jgi:hypothetical protein|tara:strand:- start:6176 stop:6598 length:423 start_codon:yes stop_codon:yes gene_type:complete
MAKKSIITVELLEKIAEEMANGDSLVKICKNDWCPSYRQIIRVVQKDPELYDIYRRGRVMQAEYYSDHISELAMQPLDKDGDPRFMNAEVQRRRLEIDSLKWTLARIQPYGLRDRKDNSDTNTGAITLTWANGEVKAEAS